MESTNVKTKKKGRGLLIAGIIIIVLAAGVVAGFTLLSNNTGEVLTYNLSEPLGDIKEAKVDINVGDGNLTVDGLTGGEPLLAGGALQYLEKQGLPERTLETFNGQATLKLGLNSGSQKGFRLPWQACNGLTEWQIQLNPAVAYDISAVSGGGIIKFDLAGLAITKLYVETGGGTMDVILPDTANNLTVTAKTGAGKVVVYIPSGVAARIHASTGMGAVNIDPSFPQVGEGTYESPDYESATQKIEITVGSGAGEVSVVTK